MLQRVDPTARPRRARVRVTERSCVPQGPLTRRYDRVGAEFDAWVGRDLVVTDPDGGAHPLNSLEEVMA